MIKTFNPIVSMILSVFVLSACGNISTVERPDRDSRGDVLTSVRPKPKPPVRIYDPDRPWLEEYLNDDGTITTVTDDSCMRGCKPRKLK